MYTTNIEIKTSAKKAGVFLYEVAEKMGMNDSAFSRKLRKELTIDEKGKVMRAIHDLAEQKGAV